MSDPFGYDYMMSGGGGLGWGKSRGGKRKKMRKKKQHHGARVLRPRRSDIITRMFAAEAT